MKLDQFLTYCAVKGIIQSKKEMKLPAVLIAPNRRVFTVQLRARGFGSTIVYEQIGDEFHMMQSSLRDYSSDGVGLTTNIDFNTIVECLAGKGLSRDIK